MRILYDYQIFIAQKFGGISRYFAELMRGMDRIESVSPHLEVVGNKSYYLPEGNLRQFNFVERLRKYHKREHKILLKNQRITLNKLSKECIDVFHPTYYDPYFIDGLKTPLVVTIHDMIYEIFPDLFPPNDPTAYYKRQHIERADKIIAVSQQTKEDILKFYPIDEEKIDVIYHGIELNEVPIYEDVPYLPKEYVLYVGGRYGYKNFKLLVQAFSLISQKYDGLNLVIAGSPLGLAERELLFRNGITEKVLSLSVNDEQLNTLYRNALFFIYPSIYEGFGIPVLESYKHECPVLLSDASCFPEIAGGAAAYFETFSLESLVEQMDVLLADSSYRKELIKRGNERLQNYSIKKCVSNTMKTYKSLL